MLNGINLPEELVTGGEVQKFVINGIDEFQYLFVAAKTIIKRHGHEPGQWEIWIDTASKTASICFPNEDHSLTNLSEKGKLILAIKGHNDELTFDDFGNLLAAFDIALSSGDMILA